jgi:hypothetical protein
MAAKKCVWSLPDTSWMDKMGSHGKKKKKKQSVLSNKDRTFAAACNKDPLLI